MLRSDLKTEVVFSSVGDFLNARAEQWPNFAALLEKHDGVYQSVLWQEFYEQVQAVAQGLLNRDLRAGHKIAFFCPNSRAFLVTELAAMSIGLVSVPLFAGYQQRMVNELLRFSDVDALVVSDARQLSLVHQHPPLVIQIDDHPLGPGATSFREISSTPVHWAQLEEAIAGVNRDNQALLMFTSGTMSFPKGVMLTHGNILSQQEALQILWQTQPGGRMLSYLPWHHSFGGIFEKFFALYSGTALGLDDSRGKDIGALQSNWKQIRPNYFFSVPKVFQELVSRREPEWEEQFFHRDLRFVFTAGAPLPGTVSEQFDRHNVPVLEGWGLTETSPCCTLTKIGEPRIPGLVGFPIPNVTIMLDDDGEILVQGPNVMLGYYKNTDENERVFTDDGFFRTGDLGEISDHGLKILTRKDRIFKLANAEKVNPTVIENSLLGHCSFIKHVLVFGSGLQNVCALVFPNRERMNSQSQPERNSCCAPCDSGALSSCLKLCIGDLNARLSRHYDGIANFVVLERELDIEKGELTPSLKVNPQAVMANFAPFINPLLGSTAPRPEGAIYVTVSELEKSP